MLELGSQASRFGVLASMPIKAQIVQPVDVTSWEFLQCVTSIILDSELGENVDVLIDTMKFQQLCEKYRNNGIIAFSEAVMNHLTERWCRLPDSTGAIQVTVEMIAVVLSTFPEETYIEYEGRYVYGNFLDGHTLRRQLLWDRQCDNYYVRDDQSEVSKGFGHEEAYEFLNDSTLYYDGHPLCVSLRDKSPEYFKCAIKQNKKVLESWSSSL